MRKSLLLFVLLTALSAGLLAGACAAVQGRREAVSYRAEPLAGDPTAADGVELTWVSTCGYHLFWHSTFPAAAPEEGTLLEAMQALPARDRAVLHLYYYEGYQTAEIAALTGLREGSVRSRLTRARTRLRQVLKGEDE